MPWCVLKCSNCGRLYGLGERVWRCSCGGVLDVVCEGRVFDPDPGRRGVWRYWRTLPPVGAPVSLGEGGTPLVEREYRGVRALFKLEYLNPTGSFKDRGSTVAISHLKEVGVDTVVVDSSGNAGASMAAYASAAGLRCRVYAPRGAPLYKKLQIAAYGAELVEAESREAASLVAQSYEQGFYAGHLWNPFFIEGCMTLAFEVFEEQGVPDAVVVPVGSGTLLLGVYKGFRLLAEAGLAGNLPRIYAVQAESNAPLYREVHGREYPALSREILADGIAVPDPPRLRQVVSAIRESGGDVVVVANEDIRGALKALAKMGFLVEPTSAVVLPAIEKLRARGLLEAGERVLAPLTGSGLKAAEKIARLLELA